ncbi:cytochrome P450 [Mycolicibacterium bacteremicum]|uniref:cytochrome P450 n=1 Tax=Mycolicibacterium bacteremicum TaxID=564198 RepID=UPI0026EAB17B|nr:cytochrome P450 [Mycolicibacterium bacteremicum]
MTSGIDWIDAVTVDELETDPYPFWARMRAEKPLAFVPALNAFALTTYDEIREFLSDATLSHAVEAPVIERTFGPANILNSNGDVHRDRRNSVDPPLRRNAVLSYIDELVRPIAIEYASQLPVGESFDIMAAYLEPVSTRGLATMLGIGDVPVATLRRWFHTIIASASNYGFDEATFRRSDDIIEEIKSALEPVLKKLEDNPDNSGLSHLLHAGVSAGQIRPRADIYSAFLIELAGGMQEPGHVVGTALLGLCGESGQYSEIVGNPQLIPAAITEGLRWIAPVGGNFRQTSRDVIIHGQTLPKGTVVLSMLSSANRDETKFEAPDRYDLHRSGPAHFSFGGGKHFCAGNVFGRELARIALEELVKVAPRMLLGDEGFQMRGWLFRAPQSLNVVIAEK